MLDLRARLDGVRDRIARAASRAGRDPASVRLIAVSKTFPVDDIRAVAAAGQTDFGENKVQEAIPKIQATADLGLTWHLVGHLQSNKARKAGSHFDAVHSIDGTELVGRLEEAARTSGRRVKLLVQVDFAGEATKHGAKPADVAAILESARACTAVQIAGLMLLPPALDPEAARPYFRSLRLLRDDLVGRGFDPQTLGELSMGMSQDFEVAIEEGATMVRVGSAIFGERWVG